MKNHGWVRVNVPYSVKISIIWKWRFPLYNDDVLTKGEVFSLPHFLTNFLLFSLMFYPGSCPNSPATCSFYSLRNVARHIRHMSNCNSPIWTLIPLLYYVAAIGERVSTPRSIWWREKWPCHYVGNNPWTKKGTLGALRVMHVSPTMVQHKHRQWEGRIS